MHEELRVRALCELVDHYLQSHVISLLDSEGATLSKSYSQQHLQALIMHAKSV